MKNLLFITIALSGIGSAMAQEVGSTEKVSHQIGISFSQPISIEEPQGAGTLPPEYIVVFNGSDLKGSRFGIGIDYQLNFKNKKDFCFFKSGWSQDNRKDKAFQHFDKIYSLENYDATLDLDLKKTQLNFSLGYGRNFSLSNRFSIDLGISVVGLFDVKNEVKYDFTEHYNYEGNDQYNYETDYHYFQDYVKWRHIGLSPLIRPVFNITEKLSVSAEAQLMGLFSFTNKKGQYEQSMHYREYDSTMEYYNYEDETKFETTFKGTFFSFSKISPLLRVAYKF